MKHILDPLYGYLTFTQSELDVISTPPVQRLRRIHQLGLSSSVYPGATHTRFEHSLGVMSVAGQLAESVGLSAPRVQAYRYAGLLHDTGHAPFSHAAEEVMQDELGVSHERRSCRVVDELADSGSLPAAVDTTLVKAAIMGEAPYDIVSGAVDADRMDYLRRDAYQTGIEHGTIDTKTIIRFAESRDDTVVFSHKCIQSLEGLLIARFHMQRSVSEHHTCRIAETMLQRAVEAFLADSTYSAATVFQWDDFQLHTHLLGGPTLAQKLYSRLVNRNLYKRARVVGAETVGRDHLATLATIDTREREAEIAARADVSPDHVLIEPPSPPPTQTPSVGVVWNDAVRPLTEVSALAASITESEWRNASLGVYAPHSVRDRVAAAAEAVLL